MTLSRAAIGGLAMILAATFVRPAPAAWEAGGKAGYESNVDRRIGGGRGDGWLGGYAAFLREPSGESRLDWSLSAVAEGAAFARFDELDFVSVTVKPGAVVFPYRALTLVLSPFAQAKAVRDGDQTALAFGGSVVLREPVSRSVYLGQYYVYTDSRARVDTYSFQDHAVGGFVGISGKAGAFCELGYEYGRGDSFRTLETGTAAGFGMRRRFSSAFGIDVVRETVDRNAVSLAAGIDLTAKAFLRAEYTFTATDGALGSATSHAAFVGAGRRF